MGWKSFNTKMLQYLLEMETFNLICCRWTQVQVLDYRSRLFSWILSFRQRIKATCWFNLISFHFITSQGKFYFTIQKEIDFFCTVDCKVPHPFSKTFNVCMDTSFFYTVDKRIKKFRVQFYFTFLWFYSFYLNRKPSLLSIRILRALLDSIPAVKRQ